MTIAKLVIRCPKHPSYTGLTRRLLDDYCESCEILRRMRGATIPTRVLDDLGNPVIIRWGAR